MTSLSVLASSVGYFAMATLILASLALVLLRSLGD